MMKRLNFIGIKNQLNNLTRVSYKIILGLKGLKMIEGYYYLHTNKELIYKPDPDAIVDIRESDFCHSAWAWDGQRQTAWQILVEALSLGAKKDRINKLSKKWNCDGDDALNYANYLGITLGSDGNQKTAYGKNFTNQQECPCGFGDTYLEAMSDLCKQIGFSGGKMWNATFKDLIKTKLTERKHK